MTSHQANHPPDADAERHLARSWPHRAPQRALTAASGVCGWNLASEAARAPIDGETIHREDRWPTDDDLGTVVILPGGEAGALTAWSNADDGSSWRWSVEFSNRRVTGP